MCKINCEFDDCGMNSVKFFKIKNKMHLVFAHCERHTPLDVGWANHEYEEISMEEYVLTDFLWLCEH